MSQVASDPNALPVGCVRCEYLEGTGTQWIDTEKVVYANEDIYVDFEMKPSSKIQQTLGWIAYGAYNQPYQFKILKYQDAPYASVHYGVDAAYYTSGIILTNTYARNRVLISPNTGVLEINGVQATGNYDKTFNNAYYPNGNSLNSNVLFSGVGPDGTVSSLMGVGRIYEYSLTDPEGNYTQHLIPILDPDGTPCMYDTVAKKFHYNKGTGQFTYKIAE